MFGHFVGLALKGLKKLIIDGKQSKLINIFIFLGDFFLAELIEAQDEENKCIVADVSKLKNLTYMINLDLSL